jgi:hypothetical protein
MESMYFHSDKLFTKYNWESNKWLPELVTDPFLISRKHKSGYIYKVIVKYKSIQLLLFDAFKEVNSGFDLESHRSNCIYRYHNSRYTNFFKKELDKDEDIKSYACMCSNQVYFDEVY